MAEQPESDDLQFERAEYAEEGKAAASCTACDASIADVYYEVDGRMICASCHSGVVQALTGGSRVMRFLGATMAGIAAGAVGAGIYFAVAELTGYEIGLVAIIVGLLVGGAVRWGAGGRGGWFYQGLAIILTYCSIIVTYIPPIWSEMKSEMNQVVEEEVNGKSREIGRIIMMRDGTITLNGSVITLEDLKPELERLGREGGGIWYHREGLQDEEPSETAELVGDMIEDFGLPRTVFKDAEFEDPESLSELVARVGIAAKLFLGAAIFIFALAVPFLALPDNIIGILIIGFAIYEAWKINQRKKLQITGPYQVAALNAENAPSDSVPSDHAIGE